MHAFTAAFFAFFILLPVVMVPFPWFLDDYDIAWSDLKALHTKVFTFIETFIIFVGAPE